MRILQCHIENFGKWSDRTFYFSPGVNVFCEKNGWGKSTLAAFIRIMFFGFSNERKRDELENERKKYTPWQGGVYGGQITFEANGKTYVVSRIFGKKEKDDVFELRDGNTNKISSDYTPNLGEELFQIDHNSFLRTVFVSQNDCETVSTDRINAKLGNLAEHTDDMNNFEVVSQKLSETLTKMSPTRKTGSLYKLKNTIGQLKIQVSQGNAMDQSMQQILKMCQNAEDELEKWKKEKQMLQARQRTLSLYKDNQAKKTEYEEYCRNLEARLKNYQEEKGYFPGELPEEEELQRQLQNASRLLEEKGSVEGYQLTREEKQLYDALKDKFTSGFPEKGEIQTYKNEIQILYSKKAEYEKKKLDPAEEKKMEYYESVFWNGIPEEKQIQEQIQRWNVRAEHIQKLSAQKATLQALETFKHAEKTKKASLNYGLAGIVAGIILLLAGAVGIFLDKTVGWGLLLTGVAAVVLALLWQSSKSRPQKADSAENRKQELLKIQKDIQKTEQCLASIEQDMKEFLKTYEVAYEEGEVLPALYELRIQVKEYHRLAEKADEIQDLQLPEKIQKLEKRIQEFLGKYLSVSMIQTGQYQELILQLERLTEKYQELEGKHSFYQKAVYRYEGIKKQMVQYIRKLGFEPCEDLQGQLQEIRTHYFSFQNACKEVQNAKAKKQMFEQDPLRMKQILQMTEEMDLESMENLDIQMHLLLEKIDEKNELIHEYRRQLEILQEKRDQISEWELELEELEERFELEQIKYRRIMKVQECLQTAKENFTARYAAPIKNGFDKYYHMLTKDNSEEYCLDANVNLTVKAYGMQHDPRMLSTGYRDLTGICMRMALVDAMYQQEKPFIMLDDPFVNLDEEKTREGMEFLKKVKEEYQILYFTCHKSRV